MRISSRAAFDFHAIRKIGNAIRAKCGGEPHSHPNPDVSPVIDCLYERWQTKDSLSFIERAMADVSPVFDGHHERGQTKKFPLLQGLQGAAPPLPFKASERVFVRDDCLCD